MQTHHPEEIDRLLNRSSTSEERKKALEHISKCQACTDRLGSIAMLAVSFGPAQLT